VLESHSHEEEDHDNHGHEKHEGYEGHEKHKDHKCTGKHKHGHHKKHKDKHVEETKNRVLDPHIWLSPSLVKIQVKNIYDALVIIDPSGKIEYKKGYEAFIKELDELSIELKTKLKPFAGSTLFVFHPTFGYFADEFGLKQVAIETGGKETTPANLAEIIEYAQNEKVKNIFVQPEFSQESAKKIAQSIKGSVVVLNPLNPDYINNLKQIATKIEKAYK